MARRRRVAKTYDRSKSPVVGERLKTLRAQSPKMVTGRQILGEHSEVLIELLEMGWPRSALLKELRADLPGLTAADLEAAIAPRGATVTDPSKAAPGVSNTSPPAPANVPTASAAKDAPRPVIDGSAGFGRETA